MKTMRNALIVYLVVQIVFITAWLVPGWFMNDVPWGLVFLPSFFFVVSFILTFIGFFVTILLGFMAWAVSENKK